MIKKSIISGDLVNRAEKALKKLDGFHWVHVPFVVSDCCGKRCDGYLTLRHCTVGGEKSGGMEIRADIPNENHLGKGRKSIRLKKGFSNKSFSNTIHRLFFWAREESLLISKREELYKRVESMTQEEMDALAATGEASGKTIEYDTMTPCDVDFYLGEMRNMFVNSK